MEKVKNKFDVYSITVIAIFILAVGLRIYVNFLTPSFWLDEAALARNVINKSFLGCFLPLDLAQAASPLFLVVSKMSVKIFGLHDFSFRIVPFLASIASVFVFYKVTNEYFVAKWTKLIALFVWAVNIELIYYAKEFKPYSLDVLFTLIILLFYLKYNPIKSTYRNNLFSGLILGIFPWFSFGSFFVLLSFIVIGFFSYCKSDLKKFLAFIFPQFISFIMFVFFISRAYEFNIDLSIYNFWRPFFAETNSSLSSFLSLIPMSLKFYFSDTTIWLVIVVLIVVGAFLIFKKSKTKCAFLILPGAVMLGLHLLRIYPFFGRLILFLFPLILLLIIKPLDLINSQKQLLSLAVVFMYVLFFFSTGYLGSYYKELFSKNTYCCEELRPLLNIAKLNKSREDIICLLSASNIAFEYYNVYFKFHKNEYFEFINENTPDNKYCNKMNNLENGKTYWFILSHDPRKWERKEIVEKWVKTHGILYKKYCVGESYMYKIKKIK